MRKTKRSQPARKRLGRFYLREDLVLDEGAFELDSVSRIGQSIRDNKPRPITAVIKNKVDRQQILDAGKMKFKATNSRYRIKQDYSQSTRLARKKLSEFYQDAVRQTSPEQVKVVGPVLHVGKHRYRYDFRSEKLKMIRPP